MNSKAALDGTLARAKSIMEVLVRSGESASVMNVAAELQLSTSTVHRLLGELVRIGWAERAQMRRYRASLEFYRLSAGAAHCVPGVNLARRFLLDTVDKSGETCLFATAMRASRTMMYVERVDCAQPLPHRFLMQQPLSLLWGAPARAILSALPDEDVRAIVERGSPSMRGSPPPAISQVREEAHEVRARGYALTRGEILEWAVGMASPVYGKGRSVIGALALILPAARFRDSSEASYGRLVMTQARRLSEAICA